MADHPTLIETRTLSSEHAIVTLEALQLPAVTGLAARTMAQVEAQKTLVRPGLSLQSGPYPVDAAGEATSDVATGQTPVAAYRQDFTFQASI